MLFMSSIHAAHTISFDSDAAGVVFNEEDNHDFLHSLGATPSSNTGPSTGANGSEGYIYLETSSGSANIAGDLSRLFIQTSHNFVTFYYHMYGEDTGTLSVIINGDVLWSKTGQQHTSSEASWTKVELEIDTSIYDKGEGFEVDFHAKAAGGYRGDIAIDEITFDSIDSNLTDFENDLGSFNNSGSFDFIRNTGTTASGNTGPAGGANGTSDYAYFETSSGSAYENGDTAYLQTTVPSGFSLSFYYHMYGENTGTLAFEVKKNGVWSRTWEKTGQQQTSMDTPWAQGIVKVYPNQEVRFVAEAIGGFMGDIAIDEITFNDFGFSSSNTSFETGLDWNSVGDFNWLRHSGGTPSGSTGPAQAGDGNYYAYFETSNGSAFTAGNTAILESQPFRDQVDFCFKYSMYGSDTGSLTLEGKNSDGEWVQLSKFTGQQTTNAITWLNKCVALHTTIGQLRFIAEAAGGYRGDIAIDEFEIYSTSDDLGNLNSGERDITYESGSDLFVNYESNIPTPDNIFYRLSGSTEWQLSTLTSDSNYLFNVGQPGNGSHTIEVKVVDSYGDITFDNYTVNVELSESIIIDSTQHSTSYVNSHDYTVGETKGNFNVSSSGSASYSIPLNLPKGSGNATPSLSLNYNSGGSNGLLGKGWSFGGTQSITRCGQDFLHDDAQTGISWTSEDRLCLNGSRLILLEGTYGSSNAVYTSEIESHFKITTNGSINNANTSFTMESDDGSTTYFGATLNARKNNVDDITYRWGISSKEDLAHNAITYTYNNNTDESLVLGSIGYAYGSGSAPSYNVVFHYSERPDPILNHINGTDFNILEKLDLVEIKQGSQTLKSYGLTYKITTTTNLQSKIEAIQECSPSNCFEPTTFEWGEDIVDYSSQDISGSTFNGIKNIGGAATGDINGDGITDLLLRHNSTNINENASSADECSYSYFLGSPNGLQKANSERVEGICDNAKAEHHSFTSIILNDFNFDGRADHRGFFSQYNNNNWELYNSLEDTATSYPFTTITSVGGGRVTHSPYHKGAFIDINGDGAPDRIARGYYPEDGGERNNYDPFTNKKSTSRVTRFFVELSTIDPSNGNVRVDWGVPTKYALILPSTSSNRISGYSQYEMKFGDFNGDGRNDFVVSQDKTGSSADETIKTYYVFELPIGENDDEIHLEPFYEFTADVGTTGSLTIADINNDGLSDVMAVEAHSQTPFYEDEHDFDYQRTTYSLTGYGTNFTRLSKPFNAGESHNLLDLDNDGDLDILTGSEIYIFDNGAYTHNSGLAGHDWSNFDSLMGSPSALYFEDFTGDGRLDVLKLNDYVAYRFNMPKEWHHSYYQGVSLYSGDPVNDISGRIKTITTGSGHVTSIDYENITAQSDHYEAFDVNANSVSNIQDNLCIYKEVNGACTNIYASGANSEASFYQSLSTGPWLPEANSDTLNENLPIKPVSGGITVVTSVSTSNPYSSMSNLSSITDSAKSIDYYYGRAFSQSRRGFLGFETVTKVDNSTSLKTQTVYRQDFPFKGRAAITQTRTANDDVLSTIYTDWRMNRSGSSGDIIFPYQVYADESITTNHDSNHGTLLKVTTTEIILDEISGKPEQKTTTINGNSGEIKSVQNSMMYESCKEVDFLSYLSVNTTRIANFTTDTKTINTDFEAYTTDQNDGYQCQLKNQHNAANSAYTASTSFKYDTLGNLKSSTLSAAGLVSRTNTNEFDTLGRYIKKQYNAKNQLITHVISANKWGLPLLVESANGLETSFTYANYYQPIYQATNDGNWSATEAQWCDNVSCQSNEVIRMKTSSASGAIAYQYLDKLGRTVRQQSLIFDGTYANVSTAFNEQGKLLATSMPDLGWTTYEYDLIGRLTTQVSPELGENRFSYSGFVKIHTNGLNQTKTETFNAFGELITIEDFLTGKVVNTYGALGNLTSATSLGSNNDPHNVVVTIGYDELGRKDWMNDPDKGYWDYHYNAYGELVWTENAENERTTNKYDNLGRLKQRIDYDAGGVEPDNIINQTTWFFDGAVPAGVPTYTDSVIGLVTAVSHTKADTEDCNLAATEYCEVFYYDNLGRASRHTKILGANGNDGTYISSVIYDAIGRTLEEYDAFGAIHSGSGIRHHYNEYGYAFGISDINTATINGGSNSNNGYEGIYRIDSMNNRGQVTASKRGNGITTDYTYNTESGRIEKQQANGSLGSVYAVQHIEYRWDEIGNLITRRNDSGRSDYYNEAAVEESFCYDDLNRLYSVVTGWNNSSSCPGDNNGQVKFNSIGNITYKEDVGSYSYAPHNNEFSGPHAVTRTGSGNSAIDYHYDANGNLTSDSSEKTIEYTVFDKPSRIINNNHTTKFFYGPDRMRWKRIDIDQDLNYTTTLYLGSTERVTKRTIAGSVIKETWERYLSDFALYSITTNGSTITNTSRKYLYKDYQGSVDTVTDEYGNVISVMGFDAWGKRRDGYNGQPFDTQEELINAINQQLSQSELISNITKKGYTGHEMLDEVGLIHMNGRVYDPTIARFVSADPLISKPDDTQSYNRYSYVTNRPMFYTDPSGFAGINDPCSAGALDKQCVASKAKEQSDKTHEKTKDKDVAADTAKDKAVNSGETKIEKYAENVVKFAKENPDALGKDGKLTDAAREKWNEEHGGELEGALDTFTNSLPSLSQVVDFGVGMGNAMSFGIGGKVSEWVNGKGSFDRESDAFTYGGYAAIATSFAGVLKGALTTVGEGFLVRGLSMRAPFNIRAQRFGGINAEGAQHWGPRIGSSDFVNRTFAAITPKFNPKLTQLTEGVIQKGTPIRFGVVGSQGFRYPGGSLQFIVESRSVTQQTTRLISR